jgi:hypothetical protein
VTFENNWYEALTNATDVLAAWLANTETKFVNEPGSIRDLSERDINETLVPIALDEKVLESYEELNRVNIILPSGLLKKIDSFGRKSGLKRSTLLKIATEEYLDRQNPFSLQ